MDNFPEGFGINLQGQIYRPVDRLGDRVIVWRANCPDCGEEFETTTALVFSSHIRRRCDACKRPGSPVKRRGIVAEQSRNSRGGGRLATIPMSPWKGGT